MKDVWLLMVNKMWEFISGDVFEEFEKGKIIEEIEVYFLEIGK